MEGATINMMTVIAALITMIGENMMISIKLVHLSSKEFLIFVQ